MEYLESDQIWLKDWEFYDENQIENSITEDMIKDALGTDKILILK